MQQTLPRLMPQAGASRDTAIKRSIDSVMWSGLARLRRGELTRFTDVRLDNGLLLRYVHEIYHEYQIPDPLSTDRVTKSIIQSP